MLIHIGDHQPPARAQHPHHLADRRQRVGGMVQVHVGKHRIQALLRERQFHPICLVELDILKLAQVLAGHFQHRC